MLAMLTPKVIRCRCQSSLSVCKSNLKNIGTALEMYSADRGAYPQELARLTPEYLRTVPVCPSGKLYGIEFTEERFQVFCAGGWHGSGPLSGRHSEASHREVKTGLRSPAYGSTEGLLPDRILFTSDGFDRWPEEYVAALRNLMGGALGILLLLAIWRGVRTRRGGLQSPASPA
jgi:hypothetical protein